MTRVLGLDVGDRRIGMALSDPLGMTAQPLSVLTRCGAAQDLDAVEALVERHEVQTIVVGLPLTLRGERGPQAQKVLAFAEALRQRVTVPVRLQDERLTTVESQRTLQMIRAPRRTPKGVVDQMAAQLILQQYLETEGRP